VRQTVLVFYPNGALERWLNKRVGAAVESPPRQQEVFSPVGDFFRELMHVGLYKRNQGRIVRQVTFAALAAIIAWGLLRLSLVLTGKGAEYQFGLPLVLLATFLWMSYRLVNMPAFADFLIFVENEMNKVSWPSRSELVRSSLVVIVMIFVLGFFLAGCEVVARVLLTLLGIL
jgi:preprotein translocase subunit SecE